jgi:phospholipase C
LLALDREQIERLKSRLPKLRRASLPAAQRSRARFARCVVFRELGRSAVQYHALQELTFDDQGKQQTMLVPKGDVLYQFRNDVNEGKLPAAISWLAAPEKFSDHPPSPSYGAWYVSEVMDVLTKNPEVWKRTIFILTYGENDGYFDHAPSFVALDPKRPETGASFERSSLNILLSISSVKH